MQRRWTLAGFILVSVAFITVATPAASRSASGVAPEHEKAVGSGCLGAWEIVPSPNNGGWSNYLLGVSAAEANDVWAVGYHLNFFGGYSGSLAQHWDGTQWNLIASPQDENHFLDVAAVAADNVWAVGRRHNASLIAHWDGAAWSIIAHPLAGSYNRLNTIIALSAGDIWAAGEYAPNNGDPTRTLVQHWDGTQWSIVPSPNPGSSATLHGMAAASATDIWAVGEYYDGTTHPLIERWDGAIWSVVPTPDVEGYLVSLEAVDVLAANDVWAVGYRYPDVQSQPQSLTLHWEGTQWSIIPSPNSKSGRTFLFGMHARSSSEVWAVGSSWADETLTMRWDGQEWGIAPGARPVMQHSLQDVASDPDGNLWAVGYDGPADGERSLITRYGVACLTPTPTLTGTPPTATPTRTPAPTRTRFPSSTPSSTRTATSTSSAIAVATNTATPFATSTSTSTGLPTATSTSLPPPGCMPWHIVSSPNISDTGTHALFGVAAVGPNDVWAIGVLHEDHRQKPFVLHWNGSQWSIVPNPLSERDAYLTSITAVAANDIWIVGYILNSTLTMHWDGTEWSVISSPNPRPGSRHVLTSVEGASSDDVWAVGYILDFSTQVTRALLLHWNGTEWSVSPDPIAGSDGQYGLRDIVAISQNDVWAVGGISDGTFSQALILRWNGEQWNVIPSYTGFRRSVLLSVTRASSGEVWAVGNYDIPDAPYECPLVLNWRGNQWHRVDTPCNSVSTFGTSGMIEVEAGPGNKVWAIVSFISGCPRCSQILHWNGVNWSVVPSPDIPALSAGLFDMGADSEGNVWAVGSRSPNLNRTFVMAYSGGITFSDVHPGDYFYGPVNSLYCRGAITGYPDNTFRPNNATTRGQTAKIVSLALGSGQPPPGQTFEDVPPGSTFYPYVEQMARAGIVGGYPCGHEGEPCGPPANRPYFRPNANITRGQIAKIVSNARGYNDTPPSETFEDVSSTNDFYVWVERLASRGVMGGYPCGGAGEPCGAGNKPYFRPNNNATRGQVSKIVSNTFFPGYAPSLKR
jgi:hypothetical protein